MVTAAGTVTTGGVVSMTRTVKVIGVATLPAASAARHVTVVEPRANVSPLAGAHVAANVPSMSSAADAAKVCVAPSGPAAWIVTSAGTVNAGGLVSGLCQRHRKRAER